MPIRSSRAPWLSLLLLFPPVASAPVAAQETFADPLGRFTVPVPARWTARSVLDAAVVLTRDPATITVGAGRDADPATVVEETMANFASYWGAFRAEGHGPVTLGGQPGEFALASARSTLGAAVYIKVVALRAPAGGIITFIENLPQEGLDGLEAEVGLIESGIRFSGSPGNPPVAAAPAPTPAPAPEPAPGPPATKGFLGIGARPVEAADLRRLKVTRRVGAIVTQLYPGGPAESAGILAGDLILGAEGAAIETPEALIALVGRHQAGDLLTLQVFREGQVGIVRVRLGRPPEE
ncbi:MAG: PDZ domain-containing protein [Gemmatimonadales bacterium]